MDAITAAIVAALGTGAISGATKIGEQVVLDAYAKLKDLLEKKYGSKSKLVKAVKELEANPQSPARKEVVKEEVAAGTPRFSKHQEKDCFSPFIGGLLSS